MSDQTEQNNEGSALRKQVEELLAENKALKAEKRQRLYKDAGIPDAAFDVLDKVYDGELETDKIREFAQSKGFALGGETTETTEAETPDPAAQRAEGEQRLSALNAGTIPARDPSINDRIAKAEAEGDWATVDRLNAQKLLEAARG